MSHESVQTFWNEVDADHGLQRRLDELFEQPGSARILRAEQVVELGREHGYDFTVAELRSFLEGHSRSGQLSEDELAALAGGTTVLNDWIEAARCGNGSYTEDSMIVLF
jgi:predicted ribosomally synthesized peptide with nif11-like leader